MQITGGSFRGRKLISPKGQNTRPSSSRLREALFSILGQELKGRSFLDLFSGSGVLSFEAISRGVESASLVEHDRSAVKTIQQNAEKLGCQSQITLYPQDVLKALHKIHTRGEQFDIIYADPPYNQGWGVQLVKAVSQLNLLKERGVFFLEEGEVLSFEESSLILKKQRNYGKSYLYQFLRDAS